MNKFKNLVIGSLFSSLLIISSISVNAQYIAGSTNGTVTGSGSTSGSTSGINIDANQDLVIQNPLQSIRSIQITSNSEVNNGTISYELISVSDLVDSTNSECTGLTQINFNYSDSLNKSQIGEMEIEFVVPDNYNNIKACSYNSPGVLSDITFVGENSSGDMIYKTTIPASDQFSVGGTVIPNTTVRTGGQNISMIFIYSMIASAIALIGFGLTIYTKQEK